MCEKEFRQQWIFSANMSMSNMTEQPKFGIERGAWLISISLRPGLCYTERERQAGRIVRRITSGESQVHLARYVVCTYCKKAKQEMTGDLGTVQPPQSIQFLP